LAGNPIRAKPLRAVGDLILVNMWTCQKCGEQIEEQFDSCWKCAGSTLPASPPPKPSVPAARYFARGIGFEVLLVLACWLLRRDSQWWVSTYNFLQYSHYPLLRLLEHVDSSSAIVEVGLLVLIGVVMAGFWGLLFFWAARLGTAGLARLGPSPSIKAFVVYGVALGCVAFLGWIALDARQGRPRPFTASAELRSLVASNTAFALDLYGQLKTRPGNLFFSPESISTSLALLYAIARNQTEAEIAAIAHFPSAPAALHPAYAELLRRMRQVQRWNRIRLLTANSLWCQDGQPLLPSFEDLARTDYRAEARLIDFKANPQSAVDGINSWIERHTNGKIRSIMNPGEITPDTSLVLCDAIYFKGRWASRFKRADTQPAPFFIRKDGTATVPMMHQSADFKMAEEQEPALALLELPYFGHDLSMVIILPQELEGLPTVESALNSENLAAWLAKLDEAPAEEISVRIPRFSTRRWLDLKPLLTALGMVSAWGGASDFSGIDGTKNLYLSKASHEAFVAVDEEGTEATAATLFVVASKSMSRRFNADHPFIFLIRENSSGSILFLGRVSDPSQESR
jgi:serpin B